jgi:hypothetical protein
MQGDPQLNLEFDSPQTASFSRNEPADTVGYNTAEDGTAGVTCGETAEDGTAGVLAATNSYASHHPTLDSANEPSAGTAPHRPARTTFLVGRVTPGSGQIMMGGFPSPPFPGPWTLRALIRPPRLLLWPPSGIVH